MADEAVKPGTDAAAPVERAPLSSADYDAFMKTGDFPDAAAAAADELLADTQGEAAAPVADDQPASREAKTEAAPEAAKPESKKKLPGQKKSAAERADELARENDAAEERLQRELRRRQQVRRQAEELEREDAAPAAKAGKHGEAAAPDAKKDPEFKKYRAMPDAPKSADFDDLDDYVAAMGVFIADKRSEERFTELYDKRSGAERAEYERAERFSREVAETEARVSKELEADPEILDRIDQRWKDVAPLAAMPRGMKPTLTHWIKDVVTFKCQHTLKLSERLTANDSAELRQLIQRNQGDTERIYRDLMRLDLSFGSDSDESGTEAAAVQPSRVSKAPPPAKVLGKKPAPGVDPLNKAIQENDFDTFNRLETAAGR